MLRKLSMSLFAVALFAGNACIAKNVLVFSKVQEGAYRHTSIPFGISALEALAKERGWQADFTTDSSVFNDQDLKKYDVIVWNNTGGVVFDDNNRRAFQNYIRGGGGYAGIHMAAAGSLFEKGSTCTEPGWPWFESLVGARFKFHQAGTPPGKLLKNTAEHIGLDGLPDPWIHEDEWYEWEKNPADNPNIKVLLWVDQKSYSIDKTKTAKHPISWYQEFEGGRVFYTALGHPDAAFNEENFRRHLVGGIEWAGRFRAKSPK